MKKECKHDWEYSWNDDKRDCKKCNHTQITQWLDVPLGVEVRYG